MYQLCCSVRNSDAISNSTVNNRILIDSQMLCACIVSVKSIEREAMIEHKHQINCGVACSNAINTSNMLLLLCRVCSREASERGWVADSAKKRSFTEMT